MGLGQWIIIIVLIAIILFGFAAVFDFSKGVIRNVYPSNDEPFIVSKVVKVVDGDTLYLESGERIRLAIINTPEKWEPGWREAKDYTTERCLNKTAVVDIDDNQDLTYGRLVGLVYCGEEGYFINLELLALQYAVVMPQYCKYSEFKDGVLCQFPIE